MRLFIALVIAAAAVPSAETPTASPIVVLVHGRGHLDADSAVLRKEWKRSLDTALASVGLPALGPDDFRLAWYADVLDPDFESPCEPAPVKGDSLGLDSFARVLLGALAGSVPKTEAPEARALLGDLLYVIDASTRCAAERRVGDVIESALAQNRPVIVVAYSLGSLVTYAYLNARPIGRKTRDLQLVTLGSPLGNRDMRGLLGGGSDSLRIPMAVIAWENVYDPDDPFAAPLESVVAGPGIRDRATASSSPDDAHYIGRYLRDPATGAALGKALCMAASNPWPVCSRLTAPRKL